MHTKAPIIIAVTGHRDIFAEHKSVLKKSIKNIISTLQKNYINTPIIFFSPLADGADRIGAEAALESQCELIVPLPMPINLYEEDFDDVSKKEFYTLLGNASQYFVVPCNNYNVRDDYYIAVGNFISSHAHILIALWDGVESNKLGGTGYVIAKKKNGIDEHNSLALPDVSKIIHIMTPRISNPDINDAFRENNIYPTIENNQVEAQDNFETMLKNIESYNNDQKDQKVEKDPYFFPSIKKIEAYNTIQSIYELSNFLALKYQRYYQASIIFALFLSISALISFEIGTSMKAEFVWVYILLLVALWKIKILLTKVSWQRKYLDYRALAEAMRTQTAWSMAGIKSKAHEHYLRKQHDEIHWIRKYLQYLTITNDLPKIDINIVIEEWIEDQRKFFDKRQSDKKKIFERFQLWIFIFFLFGVLVAAYFACFDQQSLGDNTILMAIPMSIALSMGSYLYLMGLEQEIRQYNRTNKIFHQAIKRIKDEKNLEKIIFELGKEALEENGDWLMLHRDRQIDQKV